MAVVYLHRSTLRSSLLNRYCINDIERIFELLLVQTHVLLYHPTSIIFLPLLFFVQSIEIESPILLDRSWAIGRCLDCVLVLVNDRNGLEKEWSYNG